MKKYTQLNIKITPELIEFIRERGNGKNTSEKARNLIFKGLGIEPALIYREVK